MGLYIEFTSKTLYRYNRYMIYNTICIRVVCIYIYNVCMLIINNRIGDGRI